MKKFLNNNRSAMIADECGYQVLRKLMHRHMKTFYYIQPWKDYEEKEYKSIIFCK